MDEKRVSKQQAFCYILCMERNKKCAKISVVSTTTNRKLANATDVHTIIRHSQPPNHTAMGGVVIGCQSK